MFLFDRMPFQIVKQTLSELMNNQNVPEPFANNDNEIQTSSSSKNFFGERFN